LITNKKSLLIGVDGHSLGGLAPVDTHSLGGLAPVDTHSLGGLAPVDTHVANLTGDNTYVETPGTVTQGMAGSLESACYNANTSFTYGVEVVIYTKSITVTEAKNIVIIRFFSYVRLNNDPGTEFAFWRMRFNNASGVQIGSTISVQDSPDNFRIGRIDFNSEEVDVPIGTTAIVVTANKVGGGDQFGGVYQTTPYFSVIVVDIADDHAASLGGSGGTDSHFLDGSPGTDSHFLDGSPGTDSHSLDGSDDHKTRSHGEIE